jgi:cellulose synthase/poly-beta-1,6-N-acetylglucosamine synthase-like glycosyltransferase
MVKIDIIVCTRDLSGKTIPKGLEHIPINKLIIETSTPIGEARRQAIAKVSTPVFAFIDDDVQISSTWFRTVYPYIRRRDVGAVAGSIRNVGINRFVDPYIFINRDYKEHAYNDRVYTHNTLFKTELVKDWVPTYGLNCYEDLDLGNWVINKGYKVLTVPSDTLHIKKLRSIARSAYWAGTTFVEAYHPTARRHAYEYIRCLLRPFKMILTRGLISAVFYGYQNLVYVVGIARTDIYHLIKSRGKNNVNNN